MRADRQTEGRMDRQADTTKLIVDSRNFSNAPKNEGSEVMRSSYILK